MLAPIVPSLAPVVRKGAPSSRHSDYHSFNTAFSLYFYLGSVYLSIYNAPLSTTLLVLNDGPDRDLRSNLPYPSYDCARTPGGV